MRLVFLDIDGVLNTASAYDWGVKPLALICPDNVAYFNSIIEQTECKIVVSSSWRMSIHEGDMTLVGFQEMLRSHGMRGKVVGCTPSGEQAAERWQEIRQFLDENSPSFEIESYVVIDDDCDAGEGHPFVRTDCRLGLTKQDAAQAIELLLHPHQPGGSG